MPFPAMKCKPALFRAVALATAFAVGTAGLPAPAHAQSKDRLSPVRDAEIEELMRDYATPLLRAANIDPTVVEIALIGDFSFNAFVANGRRIFINLGAIVESKTPNQLIGVLAHETGHIAGGHLSNLRQQIDAAQTRAIIAMLIGAAAVAGGAMAGADGNTIAGGARAAATAPGSIIQRDLLAYVRAQEQAADQAGISYLTKTGQSGRGMLETFKGFADKSMFTARFVDPYAVTHPMPVERIALLERIVNESPSLNAKDDPALVHRHRMAQAKIWAFMRAPDIIARRYPASDTSLPARYARAVSAYRFGQYRRRGTPDRCPYRIGTGQPLFLGVEGPGSAGERTRETGHGAVAPRGVDEAEIGPHPHDARRGHGGDQRQEPARRRHDRASSGNGV